MYVLSQSAPNDYQLLSFGQRPNHQEPAPVENIPQSVQWEPAEPPEETLHKCDIFLLVMVTLPHIAPQV